MFEFEPLPVKTLLHWARLPKFKLDQFNLRYPSVKAKWTEEDEAVLISYLGQLAVKPADSPHGVPHTKDRLQVVLTARLLCARLMYPMLCIQWIANYVLSGRKTPNQVRYKLQQLAMASVPS